MSRGKKSDDLADGPSADQFTEEHASHIPWAEDRPIVREDEKYTGSHTPVAPAHRRSVSRRRNTLNEGDRTVARSLTGLFTEQTQVDRIVGALIDAGFDAERISAVSPDDQAAGTATPAVQPTPSGRGLAAWLVDHLRRRGLSHEHAQRYHEQVAQGRRLVSVTVTTDAEDEEARSLMGTSTHRATVIILRWATEWRQRPWANQRARPQATARAVARRRGTYLNDAAAAPP